MTLAALTLTTAGLLALGVAGLSLPIIAHLLNRRAKRRIVFPTIRLLAESSASQSGLFKMRRLLLLLLRCLAVLLIALAFARPVWTSGDAPPGEGDGGAAVVIVFDNSASSAQRRGGVRLIESMRSMANRTVDALTPGEDYVNVVFAESRPRVLFPQLTRNPDAVRGELAKVEPVLERGDMPAALAEAAQILEKHVGPKRLVIVSDMQRTNWRTVIESNTIAGLMPAGTEVTVLPAEGGEANVALLRPRLEPARPIANQPAHVIVRVANYSGDATTVNLQATLDGEPLAGRDVSLEPWESREESFAVRVGEAGDHRMTIEVKEPDALAADDKVHVAATAVERVPVLVVGDEDPRRVGTDVYLMTRALAPHGDGRDDLLVRHAHAAALDETAIGDAEAVFVGRVGVLPEPALRALRSFVQRGGGIVWFSGDGPVAENLLALEQLAQRRGGDGAAPAADGPRDDPGAAVPMNALLPAVPVAKRDLSNRADPLRITSGAWGSPLLSEFDATGRQALGRIDFQQVWSFGELRDGATALLRFSDDTPALLVQHTGAGRFVLAAFGVDSGHSDIARRGSFVALMHSLVQYVRPRGGAADAGVAGRPFSWRIDAERLGDDNGETGDADGGTRTLRIVGPGGDSLEADLTSSAQSLTVHMARPPSPGFYEVKRQDRVLATAAVNLDAQESDLRTVAADEIGRAGAGDAAGGVTVNVREQDDEGPVVRLRGTPWWQWFVVAAMAAMAVELGLLIVWRR